MTNMQPSSGERHHGNEFLDLAEQRAAVYERAADNAIFAAQTNRPHVLEEVYREMNAQSQPVEVKPTYPAATVALEATVETAPNILDDTSKPDIVDNEAYLRSLETQVGQQVDAAFAEAAMAQQVDEVYREAGAYDIDAARANVQALFQNGEADNSGAYPNQGV